MSRPLGSAVAASSTVILATGPAYGSTMPAERAEAKNRIVADREVALGEDLAHRDADLTGGADDADVEGAGGHRPVPP